MISTAARVARLVICILLTGVPSAWAESNGGDVLLTFDVEEAGDAEALEALGPGPRATYFFTGDYARSHPALVRSLARAGHTIGSHSFFHDDLTTLGPRQRELDLQMSRALLQATTCAPVRWFRAPYLEYDEASLRQIVEAGYLFDSSDKAPWPRNALLPELAITVHDDRLVSDYDIFEAAGLGDAAALGFLRDALEASRQAGRPLVVLLHPRIIGEHGDVLRDFVAGAEAQGARFLSADDLVEAVDRGAARRVGLWLEANPTGAEARRIAAAARRMGVTDLVVPLGGDGVGSALPPGGSGHLDPAILELGEAGLRIFGSVAVLTAPNLLRARPDLAMVDASGRRSGLWASPSHPEVRRRASALAREMALDVGLDGLILADIAYPGLLTDVSPMALVRFRAATGLESAGPDDVAREHMAWTRWRFAELDGLVREVAASARGIGHPGFEVGAALGLDAALDYRVVERTGHDIGVIGASLDLMILLGDAKRFLLDPGLGHRVRLAATMQAGRAHVLIGAVPVAGSLTNGWSPTTAIAMLGDGDPGLGMPRAHVGFDLLASDTGDGPAWLMATECASRTTDG